MGTLNHPLLIHFALRNSTLVAGATSPEKYFALVKIPFARIAQIDDKSTVELVSL